MSERPSKRSQSSVDRGRPFLVRGHHFLQSLLAHYYGDDLFYCEVYARANCCNTVPCVRGRCTFRNVQKNDDRQGEVRKDAGEALYIVQYREPVGEALSDRYSISTIASDARASIIGCPRITIHGGFR